MDIAIQIIIGIVAGLIATILLRYLTNFLDFIPRNLHDISIGTSFEPFIARGVGDNYNDVLWFRIKNHSTIPLFIVRAVYFQKKIDIPIYKNAIKSQKYNKGYELKFGAEWKDMDFLLMPKESTDSYIPLSSGYDEKKYPQYMRGEILIEYVHAGKTGIHKVKL